MIGFDVQHNKSNLPESIFLKPRQPYLAIPKPDARCLNNFTRSTQISPLKR